MRYKEKRFERCIIVYINMDRTSRIKDSREIRDIKGLQMNKNEKKIKEILELMYRYIINSNKIENS